MAVGGRNPSRSVRRRQQVQDPLVDNLPRALATDRLDADMVGTGVPVLLNPGADRAFVTPRHDGVEKAHRAAAGAVVVTKPLAPPAVDVVLELQIAGKCLPCGGA